MDARLRQEMQADAETDTNFGRDSRRRFQMSDAQVGRDVTRAGMQQGPLSPDS